MGLKAAAANGGCSLLALKGLVFPPEFSRTKADKRDEKPGDLTSTLIGVGSCKDLRLRLGESEFVLDKALLFGEQESCLTCEQQTRLTSEQEPRTMPCY